MRISPERYSSRPRSPSASLRRHRYETSNTRTRVSAGVCAPTCLLVRSPDAIRLVSGSFFAPAHPPRSSVTADRDRSSATELFVDFDFDPRDLDRDEMRDIDMPWIELSRGPGSDRGEDDARDRDEEVRDRDRDARERDFDPRDAFVE